MDIDDIRRKNILALEKEAQTPRALADLVGMTYAQYVNLRDGAIDSKTGKRRGMRKETAGRFDAACNKPLGWLDQDHSIEMLSPGLPNAPLYTEGSKQAPALVSHAPDTINGVAELHECMAHFAALIEPLPPGDRAEALRMMQRLVAEPEAHNKVALAIQTLMPAPFVQPLRHAG